MDGWTNNRPNGKIVVKWKDSKTGKPFDCTFNALKYITKTSPCNSQRIFLSFKN